MRFIRQKTFALVTSCALIIGCLNPISAAAQSVTAIEDIDTEIMPIAELQALFPEISLQENGYVDTFIETASSVDESERIPFETFTKQYDDGECTLVIYNDGSYETYGYERNGNNANG